MTHQKNRQSPRHEGFDYTQSGAYFVTICTKNRVCLFGEIRSDAMILNPAGRMIERWLQKIPSKFPDLDIDSAVVMPNHIHGVLLKYSVITLNQTGETTDGNISLSDAIQWFKTMTTNEYIKGVRRFQWSPFQRRLWQRSFYDHVIRSEEELVKYRMYITENPLKWMLDCENPAAAPVSD